ncbi:alpha/beta hydrolase [Taibaiella koreensis]|uniref:alpha/beta hydrolase n=1 Tax=Taibaiella koreensis TaxID=1268548 RepID=UPI000E59C5E7|nr:dienelactone hydrolase family protein [Taibaiella koreensis]
MHKENLATAGASLETASRALIMIHGRGGSAADILSLAEHLNVAGYALMAPQATGHTWYPQSFLAPPAQNEPSLSSALNLLQQLVAGILRKGMRPEQICFLGFSQGACLMLEFLARNAMKYGGAAAFTGGLIGDRIYPANYSGIFDGMPVFIGSSDPDIHVPVQRVKETTRMLESMGATVTEKIYANMGHTISREELDLANGLIFG